MKRFPLSVLFVLNLAVYAHGQGLGPQTQLARKEYSGTAVPTWNCNPGPVWRDIYIRTTDNSEYQCTAPNVWTKVVSGGTPGNVVGPASAVDGHLTLFDGITGKLIKDGGVAPTGTNTGDQTFTASGDATAPGSTSTLVLTLKNTGTAGTYRSATFDAQGRETSGTNPTTFASYGLSDTSANLRAALTDELGTGAALFDGATPTSFVLTNATGLPATGLTGTLQVAQEPAHTGDVTNSAGSLALSIAANAVTLAKLATQATNTVLGNATSGTAVPTALSVVTCSTTGSALNWTTNTGFGCNTSITAAAVPVGGISGLGTGVATALAVNVGTAGSPVLNGGVLGTPSSGTVTNLTGTASININGTVGATTPTTGAFTTVVASTSVTTPTVIGGSGTTQSLTYKTTTGVGASGADHIFLTGTNGGTEAMRILNDGTVGIAVTSVQPAGRLEVNGNIYVGNTNGFLVNNAQAGMVVRTAGNLDFYNGNAVRMSLSTVGALNVVGAVTAPSYNGNTFTTGTYTLTGGANKTLTFNNTLTLAGNDSTTMTFPSTSATLARTDAANTFAGTQTFSSAPTFTSGIIITNGDVLAIASRAIGWQGTFARMKSPADGVIDLLNNAETDFSRLQFGGTTSSFPALGRSTTRLTVGLADGTSGGGINFSTASVISLASGTNTRAGNAVLVGGTVTISNTTVTANTIVILTRKTSGGTIGTAITYTLNAGTSFTITSDNILDTSTFSYILIENP